MTAIYILGAFSLLFALASGYFSIKNKPLYRVIVKTIASLFFIVVGLVALFLKGKNGGAVEQYDMLMMIALTFGMLGDIFLCMNAFEGLKGEGKLLNVFGVVHFALGHLTFVINFLSAVDFTPWTLALFTVIPLMLAAMLLTGFVKPGKKMVIILSVYGVILGLMFMSSVNFYLQIGGVKGILVLIAGVIFTASDSSLLVRDYSIAVKARVPLKFFVLITYYVAQVLFATSMMF